MRSISMKGYYDLSRVGSVLKVGDGVLLISGLEDVMMGELVVVQNGKGGLARGMALSLRTDAVGVILLEECGDICMGFKAYATGRLATVVVGEQFLGRVVSALGIPVDGLGDDDGGFLSPELEESISFIQSGSQNSSIASPDGTILTRFGEFSGIIESPAPSIIERESVCEPLHTGVVAVDAMIPIGRGQRELIIGDRQVGKTSLCLDVLISQLREGSSRDSRAFWKPKARPSLCQSLSPQDLGPNPAVIGVYVAVGQKMSSVAQVWRLLESEGNVCRNNCWMVVVSSVSDPAASQYLAPFSAVTLAEYFMRRGGSVVVVYDDLSKHANAYREVSLILRRPPGRDAFPADIFYVHSRLLERAANLAKGGSITALPIVETQEGDVSSYIPTNVISITDGQVYLSEELFNAGIRPAIDVGISVSRVGSSAQTGAMKKVTGRMKLVMAQLIELEEFSSFSSDLDDRTVFKLSSFRRVREVLKQGVGVPVRIGHQVMLLRVALSGGFQLVEAEGVSRFAELILSASEVLYPRVKAGGLYPWELGGEDNGLLSGDSETNISCVYLIAVTSLGRALANARGMSVCREAFRSKSTVFALAGVLGRMFCVEKSPR
jgi:F-type H+-transporting ATPase subunit alpha